MKSYDNRDYCDYCDDHRDVSGSQGLRRVINRGSPIRCESSSFYSFVRRRTLKSGRMK